MHTLFRDLRYGVRILTKNPVFTAVAVLSLALGIGANTAVFSVVNAVLLKSLPFKDPESLVLVWGDADHEDRLKGRNQLSATDVADFRSQTPCRFLRASFLVWFLHYKSRSPTLLDG